LESRQSLSKENATLDTSNMDIMNKMSSVITSNPIDDNLTTITNMNIKIKSEMNESRRDDGSLFPQKIQSDEMNIAHDPSTTGFKDKYEEYNDYEM